VSNGAPGAHTGAIRQASIQLILRLMRKGIKEAKEAGEISEVLKLISRPQANSI